MPEGGPVGGYSSSYAGVPEPAAAGAGYINYGQQPHQAEGQHPHQQAYVFSQDQAVGDYSMRRNLMDTVTAPQVGGRSNSAVGLMSYGTSLSGICSCPMFAGCAAGAQWQPMEGALHR